MDAEKGLRRQFSHMRYVERSENNIRTFNELDQNYPVDEFEIYHGNIATI